MKVISLTIMMFCVFQTICSQELESLDNYIENARKQWNVPGLSVTIVKDDKVILSKGYGVLSIKTNELVDKESLFMLGSTTKAMTAAAMAMLVEEGKVNWMDKVIDHLPWFRLKDPYITRELTIKDLFTHNSGLGNTDWLWVLWDYSTEEIVRRLNRFEASYSMRGGYTYQNIMYATAGLVIEKVSGQEWDQFIHKRIFDPLGMTRSCALKSCAEDFSNRASPHYPTNEGIIQIIDSNADSIGAAGSAWSCSKDIAKWMQFVLDSAEVNGVKLIDEQNYRILHKPHIIIPDRNFYPTAQFTEPNFKAYSLGWFLHDYEGQYVQFHTGSLNGAGAIIGLIPKENIGVYVMVNLDHAEVRHAIMYKVFDYLLGLGDRDWSTDLHSLYAKRNADRDRRWDNLVSQREIGTTADFSSDELVGEYKNEYLGELKITNNDGELSIYCRADRHIILNHWHYNTFLGKIQEYQHDRGTLVDFDMDARGRLSFTLHGYEFFKK